MDSGPITHLVSDNQLFAQLLISHIIQFGSIIDPKCGSNWPVKLPAIEVLVAINLIRCPKTLKSPRKRARID